MALEQYSSATLLFDEEDPLLRAAAAPFDLREIAERLYRFVISLITRRPTSSPDYLRPLAELTAYSKPLDIFTLNYDLVIETMLHRSQKRFTRGFHKPSSDSGSGVYEPTSFDERGYSVRLFKLHGSVDWAEIGRT